MTTHPLTDYREQIGLSQREVARRVGVSRWTINSIEVGRRLPSLSLIARLVTVTKGAVCADDFLPSRVGGRQSQR